MLTKKVEIQLANGLEARPVAMLVQVASQHDSTVYIQSAGKKVNAKRVGVMPAFHFMLRYSFSQSLSRMTHISTSRNAPLQ